MTFALGDLLTTLSLAAMLAVAVVYLTSKARKAASELQKEYVSNLERDRKELRNENGEQRSQIGRLEGQVDILRQMVMGRCRSFSEDPSTRGCVHCGLGLAYGQRTRAGNGQS